MRHRFAFSLSALVLACSSGDGAPEEAPPRGCEEHRFRVCKVTTEECQREVFDAVTCMRHTTSGTLPSIRSLTPEELVDFLRGRSEDAEVIDPDVARALELLGLAAPGAFDLEPFIEQLVDDIAGLYLRDGSIIVVDRARNDEQTVALLAHEIVHALQDQEVSLDALREEHMSSTDSDLAVDSLVEGEATLYQVLWLAAHDGHQQSRLDWADFFARSRARAREEIEASESPLLASQRTFPYTYGLEYVQDLWREGTEALRTRYEDPPTETHEILDVVDFLDRSPIGAPEFPQPAPPDGYSLVSVDRLGEWNLWVFDRANGVLFAAPRFEQAWRGDSIWVFGSDTTDDVALVWRIRWGDADIANELVGTRVLDGGEMVTRSLEDPLSGGRFNSFHAMATDPSVVDPLLDAAIEATSTGAPPTSGAAPNMSAGVLPLRRICRIDG